MTLLRWAGGLEKLKTSYKIYKARVDPHQASARVAKAGYRLPIFLVNKITVWGCGLIRHPSRRYY